MTTRADIRRGMNATEELLADRARAALARFFLRAGRAKGLKCGDGVSGELFGLPLILECEGVSSQARQSAAYLAKCSALIRSVSLEMA